MNVQIGLAGEHSLACRTRVLANVNFIVMSEKRSLEFETLSARLTIVEFPRLFLTRLCIIANIAREILVALILRGFHRTAGPSLWFHCFDKILPAGFEINAGVLFVQTQRCVGFHEEGMKLRVERGREFEIKTQGISFYLVNVKAVGKLIK